MGIVEDGVQPGDDIDADPCAHLLMSAEAELSAFMWAVEHSSGKLAAHAAGMRWVEELEMDELDHTSLFPIWRHITAKAIYRIVKEGLLTR